MFQVPSPYAAMQHAWHQHQPQQQQAQQQQGMPGRGQGPVQYLYPHFMPMLLPYGMPPPMPPMMPMPPGPLGGRGAPPPQGNAGEDPAAIPLHYSGCSSFMFLDIGFDPVISRQCGWVMSFTFCLLNTSDKCCLAT